MIIINVADSSRRYNNNVVNEAVETPRSLFQKLGVAYERGQTSLNGTILNASQMDQTFAQLGISGHATLNSIIKGDGAVAFINVSDSSKRYNDHTVDETSETPRTLFQRLGVAYERGQTSLNGTILSAAQLDMTFAQLGVTGRATLNSIIKGDGAF